MLEFPKDFFWGAAASAYQVEGGNLLSDWWESERQAKLRYPSGDACRHYQLYREDFDLAKQLNHNAHRLSIEWSRIEPAEGEFSSGDLNHYLEVIDALRQRGIEPIVTLHHFTNPLWFAKLGGWYNRKASFYFSRYVDKVVSLLRAKVRYWVTINEPLIYIYYGYVVGAWPPHEKSLFKAFLAWENFALSHIKAYQTIHGIYRKNNLSSPYVSIAHNMQAFVACSKTFKNKFALNLRERFFNHAFIKRLHEARALDYIGINYYSRHLIDVDKFAIMSLVFDTCKHGHHPVKKNSLGWDIYPQGLHDLLIRLNEYRLPVFILENGICTEDDNLRWEFIYQHLKNTHQAMAKGVKVLGYLYWALIDNFEWDKGFGPRFGLIDIDYHTYKRTIRDSANKFSLVCKSGRLE